MDLSRPQILSLYIVKLFQNGRYLRPWWCMLYVLGRQWISVGICCHLSTPQCWWYVTISSKPNESILSFLPLTSVPVYDALQLLTSLCWSNFLFKLRKSSEFFLHTRLCFVTSLSQCLICRLVYILLDCLHTIHCKCPTPIMALIPCKVLIIVFNNHHGGFLSFSCAMSQFDWPMITGEQKKFWNFGYSTK